MMLSLPRRPPLEDQLYRRLLILFACLVGGSASWARLHAPPEISWWDIPDRCCLGCLGLKPSEGERRPVVASTLFAESQVEGPRPAGLHAGHTLVATLPLSRPGAPAAKVTLQTTPGALSPEQQDELEGVLGRLRNDIARRCARSLRGGWAYSPWVEVDLDVQAGQARLLDARSSHPDIDPRPCVGAALQRVQLPPWLRGRARLDLVR